MKANTNYQKFLPFVDSVYRQLSTTVENAERSLKTEENTIVAYQADIDRAKKQLARTRESLPEYKNRAKTARRALAGHKIDKKRIEREWSRLNSHPAVHSVSFVSNRIKIVTNPLFHDIRVSSNTKETRRAFIGVFAIHIYPESDSIRIDNLSFSGRAHWSVSGSGGACQGDWSHIFDDAKKRGQYFAFVTNLISYLKSSDDGSAYILSNKWRDEERHIQTTSYSSSSKYYYGYWQYKIPGVTNESKVYGIGEYNYDTSIFTPLDTNLVPGEIVYANRTETLPEYVDQLIADGVTVDNAWRDEWISKRSGDYIRNILDTMTDDEAMANIDTLKTYITSEFTLKTNQ